MAVRAVYFQIPVVLSAFLLFLVQPIMAHVPAADTSPLVEGLGMTTVLVRLLLWRYCKLDAFLHTYNQNNFA